MSLNGNDIAIFDAQGSATTGVTVYAKDAAKVVLQLGSANSGNFTVKIQGSTSTGTPDFSAAQSVSNHWD